MNSQPERCDVLFDRLIATGDLLIRALDQDEPRVLVDWRERHDWIGDLTEDYVEAMASWRESLEQKAGIGHSDKAA